MEVSDLITIGPDILGGTPVFKSTRVPIKTLLDYLENDLRRIGAAVVMIQSEILTIKATDYRRLVIPQSDKVFGSGRCLLKRNASRPCAA
jgi:hypothetical protein